MVLRRMFYDPLNEPLCGMSKSFSLLSLQGDLISTHQPKLKLHEKVMMNYVKMELKKKTFILIIIIIIQYMKCDLCI